MTIVYCDFNIGDDNNGDGSAGNPYKTITKASTGLTGGDEVRVAKSPDPTALTGTLTFTQGSTAVTGSGTAFTTELAIGDFILGADGNWWEAVVISSDTSLTLYREYSGSTAAGVSSQKLGVTDTGEATQNQQVQAVNSTGSSDSLRVKISGGWDLSTQTQTGQTFFRQMHSTFANRYGYGLYIYGKSYNEIFRLHFLRYNFGIYQYYNTVLNKYISPICNSNVYGIYLYINNASNIVDSPICNCNQYGVYLNTARNNFVISPKCDSNSDAGIQLEVAHNNNLISPTCKYNKYGLNFNNSYDNNILGILDTAGNSTDAINNNIGINYINKANIAESVKVAGYLIHNNSRIFINDISGNSEIWTDYANAVKQDATAGGTGKEWKLSITGSNRGTHYPFSVAIAAVPVNANKQVTVKLYFKKSGTGIAGRLFVRGGQIAGVDDDIYTECPNDTNRNQVTLQFTPTEKGVVEIEVQAWYVSSITDYIIVDDIDITQED